MISESRPQTHSFHSDDPDEVSDFIEKIYADNRFRAQHADRKAVNMGGQEWRGIGIYDVDYEMPFHFHSSEPRPNYLFLSCRRGGSTYTSGTTVAQCTVGDVMPISSTGISSCVTQPEGIGHLSVILDAGDLNDFVSQWIGKPLATPVRFDMKPIAADATVEWNAAADCLRRMLLLTPAPEAAIRALYEHMLKHMMLRHGSNYSALFAMDACAAEQTARSAVAMIETEPMQWKTLGSVAHALGCATGALENAIRRLTGRPSAALFFDARLHGVRRALANGDGSFVGTLRAFGFAPSNRFVSAYRQRFGEPPSATYRRNPNATDIHHDFRGPADTLSETMVDRFIDESLGKPISLADLARLAGLSEHATIAAFKERFARTPMQYVIERRLELARWRLCHTSASILSIALDCGFGSQSYLTTLIKRHYGVTPRRLRLSAGAAVRGDNSRR
ncbi:helix-turn-helix transcriptional regulator [Burkholderia pseudomultivorans]|uniref:AraC family regulatory protein n=3 Tax=Burkholderia pseudomultivorans TaxID=1207504 RepID=A0A6P2Q358_9BURK|nr:AraC family transcriptional regulator [Burkholderia pseudomultivorans]MDR8727174.1 Virulence regulon transcriptional activator VirF [Burkholderia pseudomultivorans]MDR8732987.1 Virulence regulon transcriptional activator VirF [Burkholderia pseudomultivorans]MDR8739853.1 Virulence regulon transcriptional activator VirF [Burkholderia pseudomultivorans]MDR8756065.1 Virulence regulon transcriptional activator VirF [Burkholderia pseudomultivorans]MDR8775959.1 Virulence regulon transcriptional ac